MNKYFVCSDIHGFYKEWMDSLNKEGFDIANPNHKVILLGDLLDRGIEAIKCLEFVCKLIDQNRITCICGNHELLFIDIYHKQRFDLIDTYNGTKDTYKQLAYDECKKNNRFNSGSIIMYGYHNSFMHKYLDNCQYYYETDKYIFVHSFIKRELLNENDYIYGYENNFGGDWEEATWFNPFYHYEEMNKSIKKGLMKPINKTIVFRHWNTSYAWCKYKNIGIDLEDVKTSKDLDKVCFDVYKGDGFVGIDASTALSHKVNVLVLEEL